MKKPKSTSLEGNQLYSAEKLFLCHIYVIENYNWWTDMVIK